MPSHPLSPEWKQKEWNIIQHVSKGNNLPYTHQKIKLTNTGGPLYPRIQYLQFQLSTVGHSLKKNLEN